MERTLFTFGGLAISKKLKKIKKANVLFKIKSIVDWKQVQKIVSIVDFRNTNIAGYDCYDPLVMFKILFIQTIYSLSDREIEEHMNFNILSCAVL
jgi:hypothetical protein